MLFRSTGQLIDLDDQDVWLCHSRTFPMPGRGCQPVAPTLAQPTLSGCQETDTKPQPARRGPALTLGQRIPDHEASSRGPAGCPPECTCPDPASAFRPAGAVPQLRPLFSHSPPQRHHAGRPADCHHCRHPQLSTILAKSRRPATLGPSVAHPGPTGWPDTWGRGRRERGCRVCSMLQP